MEFCRYLILSSCDLCPASVRRISVRLPVWVYPQIGIPLHLGNNCWQIERSDWVRLHCQIQWSKKFYRFEQGLFSILLRNFNSIPFYLSSMRSFFFFFSVVIYRFYRIPEWMPNVCLSIRKHQIIRFSLPSYYHLNYKLEIGTIPQWTVVEYSFACRRIQFRMVPSISIRIQNTIFRLTTEILFSFVMDDFMVVGCPTSSYSWCKFECRLPKFGCRGATWTPK